MKIYNERYNVDHHELEEKISALAKELDMMEYEIEYELNNMKDLHNDWDVDMLFDAIRKEFKED